MRAPGRGVAPRKEKKIGQEGKGAWLNKLRPRSFIDLFKSERKTHLNQQTLHTGSR